LDFRWCGKKEATPDGSIQMAGQLQSQFMAIARSEAGFFNEILKQLGIKEDDFYKLIE
jgi:hypothetical protein